MSRFEEVVAQVSALEADFTKFYEQGNKAAGTRVRNGMNNLKKMAQDIRKEVTDIKNSKK